MSEEIGKHKGAVETLLHEKKELSRILQIVNSQLERHLNALDEAGVDTDRFIQQIQQLGEQKQQTQQQPQQQQKRSQNRNQVQNNRSRQRQKGQGQNNQKKKKSRSRNSQKQQKRGSQSSRSRSKNNKQEEDDVEGFLEDDEEEQDFNPL